MNIVDFMEQRMIGRKVGNALLDGMMEDKFTANHESYDFPLQTHVVLSTISISVSSCGKLVASTHGDHTVKIFNHIAASPVHVFHGHPRTPWTVKFHPSDSNFVASGCLGCEVRVWDIAQKCCRSFVRLEYSIISLAFQPEGPYIAVASGPQLHMWDWQHPKHTVRPGSYHPRVNEEQHIPLLSHSRNIRAVIFHPTGKIAFAAAPDPPRLPNATSTPCRMYSFLVTQDYVSRCREPMPLDSCSDIIPQVHLYSDGGLDISSDGQYMFTCALVLVNTAFNSPCQIREGSPASVQAADGKERSSHGIISAASTVLMRYMTPIMPRVERCSGDDSEMSLEDDNCSDSPHISRNPLESIRFLDHNIGRGVCCSRTLSPMLTNPDSDSEIVFADPKRSPPPPGWVVEERMCLFKLDSITDSSNTSIPAPSLVSSKPLPGSLMRAVTSMKISPSGRLGLIGYGVRSDGVVEHHDNVKVACEIMDLETMTSRCVMTDEVDEVNIAQFHPVPGCGILYGTKRGRVRVFH
mmetsp:Transcript_22029/g.32108  ORF Transcript_22029/g.32108 Transcript_22029/m.32108 type:complete len:522 (+) Transcript_22029:222-1787(+)